MPQRTRYCTRSLVASVQAARRHNARRRSRCNRCQEGNYRTRRQTHRRRRFRPIHTEPQRSHHRTRTRAVAVVREGWAMGVAMMEVGWQAQGKMVMERSPVRLVVEEAVTLEVVRDRSVVRSPRSLIL